MILHIFSVYEYISTVDLCSLGQMKPKRWLVSVAQELKVSSSKGSKLIPEILYMHVMFTSSPAYNFGDSYTSALSNANMNWV